MKSFKPLTEDHQSFIDEPSAKKIIIGSVAAGKTVSCCMALSQMARTPAFINLAAYHNMKHRLLYLRQHIAIDDSPQDAAQEAFIDGLSSETFHLLEAAVVSRLIAVTKGNYSLLPYIPAMRAMGFSVHVLPPMTVETSQHLPENYVEHWLQARNETDHYLMTGALAPY